MTEKPAPQVADGAKGVNWRLIGGLVLAAAALVIVLQNTKETTFELFWVSVSAPLWILVVACLVLGFLVGWLVRHRSARRATKKSAQPPAK